MSRGQQRRCACGNSMPKTFVRCRECHFSGRDGRVAALASATVAICVMEMCRGEGVTEAEALSAVISAATSSLVNAPTAAVAAPVLRALSIDLVGVSCDWGRCDKEATGERLDGLVWLPVCVR